MKLELTVQNAKRCGCASTIRAGLRQNNQILDVVVDMQAGRVASGSRGRYPGEIDTVFSALSAPRKDAPI